MESTNRTVLVYLMALNLAKFDAWQLHLSAHPLQPFVFSMATYKRLALNHHLLDRFIFLLDLTLPSRSHSGRHRFWF